MGLVVDVDAVAKLAHWQLLQELPSLASAPWAQIGTLPSVQFRARKAVSTPGGNVFRNTQAAQSTLEVLPLMRALPLADDAHLAPFQGVPDIDAGEAVLLAILMTHPEERLLTGDKRALRGLSRMPLAVRSHFAGRIMVVEEVVLSALQAHGVEWLRARICPHREVDLAISIALGSRCDAPLAAVDEGLRSYVNEMRGLCDPSLLRNSTIAFNQASQGSAGT